MATIYVSSTFRDLETHRAAVYRQLARMEHTVRAMEDYVARDERPPDRCVRDVQRSDLYIGLFAWRYGYIPPTENPEALSVTELELRAAVEQKIPTLLFILDDAAAWPPGSLDSHTGDGESGARIRDLRRRLSQDRMVSFFTSPDDLAAKVGAAVHLASALADASDASFDLAQIVGADVIDRPEMLFSMSYVPYLIDQVSLLGDAPLLKIDLRDGAHWWSTRLYALATLAHEYTAVEWLLFLDSGSRYVGMVRPADLRRALVAVQPELDACYHDARLQPMLPAADARLRAGEHLQALVARFGDRPGGEEGLRFLVDREWIARRVLGLSTVSVERSGPFDPLATAQLLEKTTPFVPITSAGELLKVIDRVGVATEIARTVVERRLGRG